MNNTQDINKFIYNLSDNDLISAFGTVVKEMRSRKIVRTKNIVGELGERYAEIAYNKADPQIELRLKKTNTKNIDAIDSSGRGYNIKSCTYSSAVRTSALHFSADHNAEEILFDFLIIVILNENMQLMSIFEYKWEQFWSLKSWSKTQKAWFLCLSKMNLNFARRVY